MNFLAHIFGLFGFIFFIGSIQVKQKNNLLIFQLIANTLYTVSYFMLGAFSAVLTNIINIIRCIVFSVFDKKKSILISLVILTLLIIPFVYNSLYDLLPVIITIIYIFSTWQDNMKIVRIFFVVAAFLWIVYNLHVGAVMPLIGNVFEIISGVLALIRFKSNKENA